MREVVYMPNRHFYTKKEEEFIEIVEAERCSLMASRREQS